MKQAIQGLLHHSEFALRAILETRRQLAISLWRIAEASVSAPSATPSPIVALAEEIGTSESRKDESNGTVPPVIEPVHSSPWPAADSLLELLTTIESTPNPPQSLGELRSLLSGLTRAESMKDDAIDHLLNDLRDIAIQLSAETEPRIVVEREPAQLDALSRWSRLSYELQRRVVVWREVHALAQIEELSTPAATEPFRTIGHSHWDFSEVDPAWREYLRLDGLNDPELDERTAARRVLARYHSIFMSPAHQATVRTWLAPDQFEAIRQQATAPLDLPGFLKALEDFHQARNGFTESRLNSHYQSLLWNGESDTRELAQAVENHYRNANVRISISESTMNRLLSGSHTAHEPVRDQILGASVSGRSQITNQLSVDLVPNADQWSLVLSTRGNVRSRTQAQRDGFVIHSVGQAEIVGSKPIQMSQSRVTTEASHVDAVTENQVIGLDSPYDDIPIIGWTARRIAQRKQQTSEAQVEQIVRSRIRSRVQERMEEAVTGVLEKTQAEFNRWVTARFQDWDLEPQPIEMSTTADELIVRYRLAGFDQMAGATPRPAIVGQTAVSVQVHDSAVNNLLQRLDLAGRPFTLESLTAHLENKLQTHWKKHDAQSSHQVDLVFAPYDAIRLDFDQDCIQVSLRFRELTIDRRKTWKKVSLSTKYAVEFDGFYLTLRQVDGVRASGSQLRVRDEMAIGAIFNQLLQDEYQFSLLPQSYEQPFADFGIQLADISLDGGWLSVAYRDSAVVPAPVTASLLDVAPRK